MQRKIAWTCSARAFEASRRERLPRPLRHALVRTGVMCFWTALAFESRALDVWREQRAQRALVAPGRTCADAFWPWAEHMRELLSLRGRGESVPVPAWSLPDSPKMRGLGLGRMWAVLCPYCDEFHTHSPGEGLRTPHCCTERDRQHYTLEFAGLLPVAHRNRFYRSKKTGLPRLLHHWPDTATQQSEAVGLLAA